MIEVLFGESEAASMKAAKNKIVIGGADGPTAVWIAGKKRPPERGSFEWIEGTGEEVVCLGFLLKPFRFVWKKVVQVVKVAVRFYKKKLKKKLKEFIIILFS